MAITEANGRAEGKKYLERTDPAVGALCFSWVPASDQHVGR